MKDIKGYIKEIGISKQELASKLLLSRPTLDAYIDLYESEKVIPKERYRIAFSRLFDKEMDADNFYSVLDSIKFLLERDNRLGVDNLEPDRADIVSRVIEKMSKDMESDSCNLDVYKFIEMLIRNYHGNVIMERLAEYFVYFNNGKIDELPRDEQVAYYANFYRCFDNLLNDPSGYDSKDYKKFMERRKNVCRGIQEENQKQKEEVSKLIQDAARELEASGQKVTSEEIIKMLARKL